MVGAPEMLLLINSQINLFFLVQQPDKSSIATKNI